MTNSLGLSTDLGQTRAIVDVALARLEGEQVMSRIWEGDHTVWKPSQEGIVHRLGWLDIVRGRSDVHERLDALAGEAREAGYTRAVLLGVGGFGLIPEFCRKAFGVAPGFPDLGVIDTTHPNAVLAWTETLDPAKTLWLVSSKFGDTIETISLLKYFFSQAARKLGESHAGEHFIAIADSGTPLAAIADEWNFRAIIPGDPEIGGRYAALSPLGLVPAALIGLDFWSLLERARAMASHCGADVPIVENPAARLGVIMAELARAGRDKLTLLVSREEYGKSFGAWVAQLVAESTGKEGRGVLPIVDEPLAPPSAYGPDRLFVCLNCEQDDVFERKLESLRAADHPLVRMNVSDPLDFGGQIFLWELATVVACYCLGVNPFNQPDVKSSVVVTRELVRSFKSTGAFPEQTPSLSDGVLSVYGAVNTAETPRSAVKGFLQSARPPEYVSIHAYLMPSSALTSAIDELRERLRDGLGIAVTVNFGPGLLYSTGQLYKGDAGRGLFIQLTAEVEQDVAIPDEMGFQQGVLSFAKLTQALALGDFQALIEAGRRVIRLHFNDDVVKGLSALTQALDFQRRSTIPP